MFSGKRRFGILVVLPFGLGFLIGCPATNQVKVDIPDMVSVQSGNFPMGDPFGEGLDAECPVHEVSLGAYRISKYEITNKTFCAVLNWALGESRIKSDDGSPYKGGDPYAFGQRLVDLDPYDPFVWVNESYCAISFDGRKFFVKSSNGNALLDHPVVNVTWFGAAVFCNWLNETQGLTSCYETSSWVCDLSADGYRLPTEAEWERAAAWDGTRHWRYAFLDDAISFARCNYYYANPLGLTGFPNIAYTSPVGWYNGQNPNTVDSPSPVGCYDMSGNVYEWCTDWYGGYSSVLQVNPTGQARGEERVIRGGSWDDDEAFYSRSSSRYGTQPNKACFFIGFRVAFGKHS